MMSRWQAMWIFMYITCSHTGNCNEITDNGENLDIRQAVNTSETLWLLQQNYMNGFYSRYKNKTDFEEETCIRNNMVNISKTEYYFTQTMYVQLEDDRGITQCKGIFYNDTKSMKVIDFDAPSEPQLWTLQYQEPENGRCMVFIIQELQARLSDDDVVCHMYIRGRPKISDPPSGCRTFLEKRCNSTKIYKPYRETCTEGTKSSDKGEDNNIGFSNQI